MDIDDEHTLLPKVCMIDELKSSEIADYVDV